MSELTEFSSFASNGGAARHSVGDWTFEPASNELVKNGDRVRLEDRAARVLEALCEADGGVVSRQELIDRVWAGRSLSDNSVAIVISDLRKALGDDAKSPRFIETVAKRGYRLATANGAAAEAPPRGHYPSWPMLAAAAACLIVITAAAVTYGGRPGAAVAAPPPLIITVNNLSNATGEDRYGALAASVNELTAAYLTNAGDHVVIRDRWDFDAADASRGLYDDFGREATVIHLSGRIILEDGGPVAALFANDPDTDALLWADTVRLGDGGLEAPLHASMDDLLTELNNGG